MRQSYLKPNRLHRLHQYNLLLLSLALFLSCHSMAMARQLAPRPVSDDAQAEVFYEQCLAQVFAHPAMHNLKSQFLQRAPASKKLADQLDKYCQCTGGNVAREQREHERHGWSHAFRERHEFFSDLDQCAVQNLDNQLLVVAFSALFENYLHHIVLDRLQQHWPVSLNNVAHESSYQGRISCLEQELLQRCSRVTSLHMSFRCIQHYTVQSTLLRQLGEQCPPFSTTPEIAPQELAQMPSI